MKYEQFEQSVSNGASDEEILTALFLDVSVRNADYRKCFKLLAEKRNDLFLMAAAIREIINKQHMQHGTLEFEETVEAWTAEDVEGITTHLMSLIVGMGLKELSEKGQLFEIEQFLEKASPRIDRLLYILSELAGLPIKT